MIPAPYTRETLDLMRRGATDVQLGWPRSTYERIARDHGIDVLTVKPPTAPPPPVREPNEITWDVKTGELARGPHAIALPTRMAKVFNAVYRHYRNGNHDNIDGAHIREAVGVSSKFSLSTVTSEFNARAVKLSIRIEGNKGHGGGYRFVDLHSSVC